MLVHVFTARVSERQTNVGQSDSALLKKIATHLTELKTI